MIRRIKAIRGTSDEFNFKYGGNYHYKHIMVYYIQQVTKKIPYYVKISNQIHNSDALSILVANHLAYFFGWV